MTPLNTMPIPPDPHPAAAALGITAALLQARGLPRYEEPAERVPADTHADGRVFELAPPAALAWHAMKAAAAGDGVVLTMESAFRSVARQAEILGARLAAGQTLDEALRWVAPPGCSEHHTARAIDIGTPGCTALEEDFESTAAFAWLQRHAARFGFSLSFPRGNRFGYGYEPWHWCWQPAVAAA